MRRFNYTGRHKLQRAEASVAVLPNEDGTADFQLQLKVEKLRPNHNAARIHAEAYLGNRFERFDFGTVGSPRFAARRRLQTFTAAEAIDLLFRVKIVDLTGHPGRLVAIARSIRPVGPADVTHSSLLPVQVQPLDDVVFKVQYPENALPILVLNESLDTSLEQGMKSIAKGNPLFVSLVYPGAVREILTRILIVDELSPDEEDEGHWVNRWIRFAESRNGETRPSGEDMNDELKEKLDQWIDLVVQKFGKDLNSVRRFENAMVEK
ncbi:MAG: hypothetical protein IID44_19660 [Planctomycetes bacterium]|nr:hypothetical protein [Planctomycetota bacterium]